MDYNPTFWVWGKYTKKGLGINHHEARVCQLKNYSILVGDCGMEEPKQHKMIMPFSWLYQKVVC